MFSFETHGSKGGTVVRALASHHCGPGSNPGVDAICGLSLLLVLSLVPRGFSPGTPVFPSPQKPTFPNSNSTRNQVDEEPLCGCATCKSLFNYFIYFIWLFIHLNSLFKWLYFWEALFQAFTNNDPNCIAATNQLAIEKKNNSLTSWCKFITGVGVTTKQSTCIALGTCNPCIIFEH